MRNINKIKNSFIVKKYIKDRQYAFGRYPTVETARRMRDELIKVNWDINQYQNIRDKLRAEGVEL